MKIGDRIRVTTSVIVYNHPQHRKEAFDLNGLEGEIENVINPAISASLPVKVRFEKRYAAHLRAEELEII